MLIGIAGKKRTGKDTVADVMMNVFDAPIQYFAFAHHLKAMCHITFGTPMKAFHDPSMKESLPSKYGTPRGQMITLSDLIKGEYGEDFFVDIVRDQLFSSRLLHPECHHVVTDVRYPNEAAMIRDLGGVILHVLRETGTGSDHSSEAGLPIGHRDFVVENTGTIEELERKVRRALLPDIEIIS